LALRAQ